MNAINPIAATLEDRRDDLLVQQIAVNGAISKWIRLALETLPDPQYPLTWPCLNVDRADIVALLQAMRPMIAGKRLDDYIKDTIEAQV